MTQKTAMEILKTGANVFLTGEPGSGKTFLVDRYIEYLRQHGISVAVTAATGIAATHLGGMTIHSWSGIGVSKNLSDDELERLKMKKRLASRAQKTRVLIIDEVSMLDAQVVATIDRVLKTLRQTLKPFGGMQVVLVGDFFQLPPVTKVGEGPVQFAFESSAWQTLAPVVCYLSEQHRQEDGEFLAHLSSIRRGRKTAELYSFLSSRQIKVQAEEIQTRLYSHNVDVDRVNNKKLAGLEGEEYHYEMSSRGAKAFVEQLKKSCLSPELLTLKQGARVMFTKNNVELDFVNGTLGEVVGFADEEIPIVRTKRDEEIEAEPMEWTITDGDRTLASISQVPLRLAWAITVHKSQGMTLDEAVVDLSRAFEYGQGYVAMSRVRTGSGLFLVGYNRRALEVHPEIIRVDEEFRNQSQRAVENFNKIGVEELINKQKSFILACGGSFKRVTQAKKQSQRVSTYELTLELFRQGKGIEAIAKERGLVVGTIIGHIEQLYLRGKLAKEELEPIVPVSLRKSLPKIHQTFEELGTERLSPVFEKLEGIYSYNDLRIARWLIM